MEPSICKDISQNNADYIFFPAVTAGSLDAIPSLVLSLVCSQPIKWKLEAQETYIYPVVQEMLKRGFELLRGSFSVTAVRVKQAHN